MPDKLVSARDFAIMHGWVNPVNGDPKLVKAHKHLRKKWMPKPVKEDPPMWDLEAVKRAERKHESVTDWLEGKGKS